MKIKLTHSGEGTPATLLCNGQHGGLRSNERIGPSIYERHDGVRRSSLWARRCRSL